MAENYRYNEEPGSIVTSTKQEGPSIISSKSVVLPVQTASSEETPSETGEGD